MWIRFSPKPITMSTVSDLAKYRSVRKMSESFAPNQPDGVDVRHPGLNVLGVYDNPHVISFFMNRTGIW